MTAFTSLILLIIIVAVAMASVAYSNYTVEKNKQIGVKLEKMKVRVEELEDVVLVLDTLCEKRVIPKLVNDEVIDHYELMIQLQPKATYLAAGLSNAQLRANDLSDETSYRQLSRACKSDAQIARYRAYLQETLSILRKQHSDGKLSTSEVQAFSLDIDWLMLQVKVISHITEGHKAYIKQEILSANAFYKKAQTELMKSSHPDPRRHEMINQMADLLFGRRKSLDPELMPEIEFNPDSASEINPESESDNDVNEALLQEEALLAEQQKDSDKSRPSA